MIGRPVSDCIVKAGELFFYSPNSLRRDIDFDFTPPAKPIFSNSFKELRDRIRSEHFAPREGEV